MITKMAISTYISIITLNVNGLNAPTERHILAELRQKQYIHIMLSTRDPLQIQGHIQTKCKGMEEGIPCKRKSKENWSSNIRQNRL